MTAFIVSIILCDFFIPFALLRCLRYEKRAIAADDEMPDYFTLYDLLRNMKFFLPVLLFLFIITLDYMILAVGVFFAAASYSLLAIVNASLFGLRRFYNRRIKLLFAFIYMLIVFNAACLLIMKNHMDIWIILIGLLLALILCICIIVQAITDPQRLKHKSKTYSKITIFRSMVFLFITIFIVFFLMVYTTYLYDNGFYMTGGGDHIHWYDLLHYTLVSASRIGEINIRPANPLPLHISEILEIVMVGTNVLFLTSVLFVVVNYVTKKEIR